MGIVVFYGSCQAAALATMLKPAFAAATPNYEVVTVVNWQLMTRGLPLPAVLTSGRADVLVAQVYEAPPWSPQHAPYNTDTVADVLRSARSTAGLEPPCIITLPFLSFHPYFVDRMDDPRNSITKGVGRPHGAFPSGCRFLLDDAGDDMEVEAAVERAMRCDAVPADEARKALDDALQRCDAREAGCTINVAANMIRTHYKTHRLFHSRDHPVNALLRRVAVAVADACAVLVDGTLEDAGEELLLDYRPPVLPSIRIALGLTFAADDSVLTGGACVSDANYLRAYSRQLSAATKQVNDDAQAPLIDS